MSFLPLSWLLFKLVVSLYLVATALSKFDIKGISSLEVFFRVVLAVGILVKISEISNLALIFAIALLVFHQLRGRLAKV